MSMIGDSAVVLHQIVNGKHKLVISALLHLTGSAVGFVDQWRGSWKFTNDAAKTKMLYGPRILCRQLEVLTRERYTRGSRHRDGLFSVSLPTHLHICIHRCKNIYIYIYRGLLFSWGTPLL
ncbi:hypothetical protein J1N35_039494 [Gossypium stocksii]|uniref:Uncharacterized protein n=1 Tax=Gossypium stocksii TaxID=47602 RepID=A0A9D3ZNX7_9ROSI|nr:hypothetical protein J1N35_039494 [Gossypium stocksii]